ncbi:type I restriction enzyme HsdR N-terminal domain-containing protein [Flavihumibacter rivuli]|uniref:type I restriction enzyme HsdR N-terminal domain-containing protein n=1 Tax=Flavihumibacter rivuli TaxID=2838156 RepID=UPI001BDF4746|nr:type I restriction enzyme HsdR N-terminal domain-containing protein [Flavihumibacter rivuli]ULQ58184.1 type I restriction enzyme HsdR N-terminal domain-containing protein [Flavihumibacter rivuli]
MVQVAFPEHDFRMRNNAGKRQVYDECRRKWVAFTPEEWVRQNFLQYLLKVLNYPGSLIAVEKELVLGELKKRFDILVYNQAHQPWLMVECKAMDVRLDEEVLHQVLRYNMAMPVRYLVITNGHFSYCFERKDNGLDMRLELPSHS